MRKRKILELLIIIGLGFIPFLWFHGEQLILGHDAGLTLSPVSHFTDRLYAWTERFGFGSDQTYAIPGFFIHGLEALVAFLGFDLQTGQKIVFTFWLLLPGLTMYYFARKIAKRLHLEYFVLPVTVLYMLNHFLLQGWYVAERTKFSIYAVLPLIMAYLFDWEDKKRSSFKTALLISLALFFLNGEASFPLFGGLILSILVFILFYFINGFSLAKIKYFAKLTGLLILIGAFLNAYWLLPYGGYLLQTYSRQIERAGGLGGVLGWIDYVSANSSFYNMFRLQGIPEWYLNNLHPYASIFLNNPILIAFSLLIPVAAFLPLYLIKDSEKRKKIIFFSFLALFTMVFMAGSHPPFGSVYVLLINFLPGFIAFRNPFYKFAPALWFSYAVLIGFTISYLLTKIKNEEILNKSKLNKSLIANFFYLLIPVTIILYSFPFLTGSFFDYAKGERSTRINVPQYVFDFGKWSDSPERINTKVLALPAPNSENKFDAYNWGYWSLSPLTSLLTNAPIINESNYMSSFEISLVEAIYKMMKNNEPGWQNLARLLGIKSFLLRKDFTWDLKGSPADNPADYEEALKSTDLKLVKKFGEWEVYDFNEAGISNIRSSSKVNYLLGGVTDLSKVSSLPNFNFNEPIYVSSANSENQEEILEIGDKLLAPLCVSCNLQHKFINIDLYRPVFTRNSIFYPLLELKNRLTERKLISTPEKIKYYLYKSLRNILAFEKLVSQKEGFDILKEEIEDYGRSLENLYEPLSIYFSSIDDIDNNFLLELTDVLRIEKTTVLRNSSDLASRELLNLLNEKYDLLEKIREKIDQYIWRTTDEVDKKFLVLSDSDTQFDFLYKPNLSVFTSKTVNFTLDGDKYEREATPSSSGWFSLGQLFLPEGIHKLSIEQPPENLYSGPSSVKLNSSSDFSCFLSNKITGFRNDVYKISFRHNRLSGSKKLFVKILSGDVKPNPLDTTGDVLDSTSVLDNYTLGYNLWRDETFYLSICNSPLIDKEDFISSIELSDINIRKITVPDVVFHHSFSQDFITENKFDKISQTEYSVSLDSDKEKEILIFGESYNKNWILEDVKNSNQFTVNGHANGWVFTADKSVITIKYKLQDFVKLGFAVSGISFIFSMFYLLIISRKK